MLRKDVGVIKTQPGSFIRSDAMGEMEIIVDNGARDPLDYLVQPHVIPAATPMAPVAAEDGHYRPIRRTTLATNVAATTLMTVVDAEPFDVGDVLALFTTTNVWDIAVTVSIAKTVAAVNVATNVITVAAAVTAAATGAWVEVVENGHLLALAGPNDYDPVLLADPLQNQTPAPGATTFCVPASGIFAGSAEATRINGPSDQGPDALLEWAFRSFRFIPAEPGA